MGIRIWIARGVALAVLFGGGQAMAAGAIAVDDDVGVRSTEVGYGIGSGETREEAADAAMKQCRKAGNDGCKVVVRYDKCGAYASSKDHSGIGWGGSEEKAKDKALDECGEHCHVVASDCAE